MFVNNYYYVDKRESIISTYLSTLFFRPWILRGIIQRRRRRENSSGGSLSSTVVVCLAEFFIRAAADVVEIHVK